MKRTGDLLVWTLFTLCVGGITSCAPAAPSPTAAPKAAAPAPKAAAPAAAAPKAAAPAAKPAQEPAAKDGHSPEVQRLLTAARQNGETELDLSYTETAMGGSKHIPELQALFNKTYGTNIKINFTPGDFWPEMVAKTTAEVKAGRPPTTEILVGGETQFAGLTRQGVLEEYDYTLLSPRITRETLTPENLGVQIGTRFPGITYNTDLVPQADAPKKLTDTLNPRFKGKIAVARNATSLDHVALLPGWDHEKMKTFSAQLAQNAGGTIVCSQVEKVASGEFHMLALTCGQQFDALFAARGAPVKHAVLDDAATMNFVYLGVPRNAPHANLAKLLINAILTEEGQAGILQGQGYASHLLEPKTAALHQSLTSRGIQPLKINAHFVAENFAQLERTSEEYWKIIQQNLAK